MSSRAVLEAVVLSPSDLALLVDDHGRTRRDALLRLVEAGTSRRRFPRVEVGEERTTDAERLGERTMRPRAVDADAEDLRIGGLKLRDVFAQATVLVPHTGLKSRGRTRGRRSSFPRQSLHLDLPRLVPFRRQPSLEGSAKSGASDRCRSWNAHLFTQYDPIAKARRRCHLGPGMDAIPATEITALLGRGTRLREALLRGPFRHWTVSSGGEIKSDDTLIIGDGAEVHAEIGVATVIVRGGAHPRQRPRERAIEITCPGQLIGKHQLALGLHRARRRVPGGSCRADVAEDDQADARPAAKLPPPPRESGWRGSPVLRHVDRMWRRRGHGAPGSAEAGCVGRGRSQRRCRRQRLTIRRTGSKPDALAARGPAEHRRSCARCCDRRSTRPNRACSGIRRCRCLLSQRSGRRQRADPCVVRGRGPRRACRSFVRRWARLTPWPCVRAPRREAAPRRRAGQHVALPLAQSCSRGHRPSSSPRSRSSITSGKLPSGRRARCTLAGRANETMLGSSFSRASWPIADGPAPSRQHHAVCARSRRRARARRLADAAAKADEARFGHFAQGGVFLGTDGTARRWTVPAFRAYAHPHSLPGKAWSFRATRREITWSGNGLVRRGSHRASAPRVRRSSRA